MTRCDDPLQSERNGFPSNGFPDLAATEAAGAPINIIPLIFERYYPLTCYEGWAIVGHLLIEFDENSKESGGVQAPSDSIINLPEEVNYYD